MYIYIYIINLDLVFTSNLKTVEKENVNIYSSAYGGSVQGAQKRMWTLNVSENIYAPWAMLQQSIVYESEWIESKLIQSNTADVIAGFVFVCIRKS